MEQDGCTVPCVPFQQHLPWALHCLGCSAPARNGAAPSSSSLQRLGPAHHPLESQIPRAEPPRGHQLLQGHHPQKSSPAEAAPLLYRHQTHAGMNSLQFPGRCCPGVPWTRCPEAVPAVLRAGVAHTAGSCEVLGYSPRPQMEIGGCTILQPRTDPFLPGAGDATPSPLLLSRLGDRALLERGHRPGWRLGVILGGVGSAGGLSSQGRVKARTLRLPPAHPALGCHPELRLLPASSSHVRLGKDLSRAGKAARGQRGDSVGEGRMAWGWSDLLPPRSPPGSGAPTAGGCQERHQLPQGSPTRHQEQVPDLLLPWDLQY